MKRASLILLCLIVSLTQAQTNTYEVQWEQKNYTERRDFNTQKDLAYVNNDTIPVTGTIIFYDSRGVKSSEGSYVNGLKHGKHIVRYYETGEPHRAFEYVNGKKVGMVSYSKDGQILKN